jgi:deoxycytidine triphosphate deaminase
MASAMLDFFDKDYFYEDCQCERSQAGYCVIHNSTNISEGVPGHGDGGLVCGGEASERGEGQEDEREWPQYISLTPNSERASPNWPSLKRKVEIDEGIKTKAFKFVINQSFPRQPTEDSLIDVIEYRIKLLSTESVVFLPGEHKIIKTCAEIVRKAGRLSLLMKPPDNLALRFLSEGFISPSFRGDISVNLQNANNEELHLSAGTVVGYLIMSPFVQ